MVTIWVRVGDVEPPKLASPEYVAVMSWFVGSWPGAVCWVAGAVQVAVVPLNAAAAHRTVDPSEKLTVPVAGMALPPVIATTAV